MELLEVLEVASRLKTTKNVVYSLIKHGHIVALKLGRLKVTTKELDRFILQAEGKDYSDHSNVIELEVN